MVEQIHGGAVKRAEEISKRQISGAETARTKERLRLQNILLDEAVEMLQKELIALRNSPEYLQILAGLALEAAARVPAGTMVKIQLAQEDGAHGETLAARLADFRPDLAFSFDTEAAPILGGVWLSARDGPGARRLAGGNLRDERPLAERVLSILRCGHEYWKISLERPGDTGRRHEEFAMGRWSPWESLPVGRSAWRATTPSSRFTRTPLVTVGEPVAGTGSLLNDLGPGLMGSILTGSAVPGPANGERGLFRIQRRIRATDRPGQNLGRHTPGQSG